MTTLAPITAAVTVLRAHWESRFIDTGTVTRLTDRGAINATTRLYDSPTTTTLYTGPMLVRPNTTKTPKPLQVGESAFMLDEYEVLLPWDAGSFYPDDYVSFTTVHFAADLVGRLFVVSAAEVDSYNTKTRLVAKLEHGPGEITG